MNNSELQTYLCEYKKLLKDNNQEEAVKKASSKVEIKEENSNRLLVFVGTYKVDKYISKEIELLTYENDPRAKYKRYMDIETGFQYNVNMKDVKDFEETHNVVYRGTIMNNILLYYINYMNVRNEFFEGILTEPQDKVVLKLKESSEK